jgi:hypothetical protein
MAQTKKKKTANRGKQLKKIQFCQVNISTTPHSADRYRLLLRAAFSRRVTVPYRGDTHAMIGQLATASVDGIRMLAGRIYVFNDIGKRWLDLESREEATPALLEQIEVPENLRPNFKDFEFLFDPVQHRLVFDARLGPNNGARIFSKMLNSEWLLADFGEVAVSLVQASDGLDKIFGLVELRKLTIFISRPNPDDLEGIEEEMRARLEANHAESRETTYTARAGEGLTPEPRVKILAQVALTNGYVIGHGINQQGAVVDESTKNHPDRYTHVYEEDGKKTLADFFRDGARKLLAMRVGKPKKD